MTATIDPLQPRPTDPWQLSRRIEAWAGEIRVNVIRIIAIALFYCRHLIEMWMTPGSSAGGIYHLRVTIVVMAWAGAAAVIHLLLVRRYYPPAMKFVTSIVDVLMITMICAIAGGPKTPLMLIYFALIAAAPLRLSLELVWVTTGACILGYLILLAYYAWYLVGSRIYYSTPEVRIPRASEIIVVLALLVTGLFAGQILRQVRRMIERAPQLLPPISAAQEGQA